MGSEDHGKNRGLLLIVTNDLLEMTLSWEDVAAAAAAAADDRQQLRHRVTHRIKVKVKVSDYRISVRLA